MLKSPATAVEWEIVFNASWKKAFLLPISTQILPGSSGHSFYSFPPFPIPFQKINKATPTSSPPDIWTMWVWLVFPSHTIWLPSLSLLVPTKTWHTAHSTKCIGYISTKHHSAKRSKDSFEKNEGKVSSPWFPSNHIHCPLLQALSHLFFLPVKKKEKPQKLIKTKNKPFRSHSFEHILVFLSKTHHSTINHKSP